MPGYTVVNSADRRTAGNAELSSNYIKSIEGETNFPPNIFKPDCSLIGPTDYYYGR